MTADRRELEDFWQRCVASGAVAPTVPTPSDVWAFGDSPEMANELVDLVVNGPKRATAGALAAYDSENAALPEVGDLSIVTDGAGRARAVTRITDVRVGPLSSVDDAFAWDEGEGDRTRASWLADHEAFFRRHLPTIGVEFHPDVDTVFERFELLYGE